MMNELCDFIPQDEDTTEVKKNLSNMMTLPGDDLDDSFEAEYNRTIVELHTALKILDEWQDLGDAIAGKSLRDLLGSAYGEFVALRAKTHLYLKDWDFSNMVESPDVEVVNGVIQE